MLAIPHCSRRLNTRARWEGCALQAHRLERCAGAEPISGAAHHRRHQPPALCLRPRSAGPCRSPGQRARSRHPRAPQRGLRRPSADMHRRPGARGRQAAGPAARQPLPGPAAACPGSARRPAELDRGRARAAGRSWPPALARGRPARREAFRTPRHGGAGGGAGDAPSTALAAAGAAARRSAQPGSPADMFQSALSSLDLFDARPPPIEEELDLEQALGAVEQPAAASVGRAVYEVPHARTPGRTHGPRRAEVTACGGRRAARGGGRVAPCVSPVLFSRPARGAWVWGRHKACRSSTRRA